MAKGFDRSFPDIGAKESSVTGEQILRWRPSGALLSGIAAPEALDLLVDESFWEADPPITRVGAVVQALQSRIWAAAEVALSDIERQWYLRRSMDLQRFADWVQVKARDLTLPELRQKVHDIFLAYYEGGASRALRRVVGAYTGSPAFLTRTEDFPGYWTVGQSYVTPQHAFAPMERYPGVLLTSVSTDTPGGVGSVHFQAAVPGEAPKLAWRAPDDTDPGEFVEVLKNGRLELQSATPGRTLWVWVTNKAVLDLLSSDVLDVNVIELPSTCEDHENWVPGASNLAHGIWVETLGFQAHSDDENNEFLERLRDVADLAELNLEKYALEEPGGQLVPAAVESFWERTLSDEVPCFGAHIPDIDENVQPWPSSFVSGEISGITPPSPIPPGKVCVPDCNGPFIVIRERFNQYEDAFAENLALGPTFHWEIQDEIVSQPSAITGVVLSQISFDTLSGRGVLGYDPASDALIWQAPDPDGPDGLDPTGSSASILGTSAVVIQPQDITGVTVLDVAPGTPEGIGKLRFFSGTQELSWEAPGDAEGSRIEVPADPEVFLTLRSANTSYSLSVRVVPFALPAFDQEEDISVLVSDSIPGVSLIGVTAHNRPGTGVLELLLSGATPALRWTPPAESVGPAVLLSGDGFYVIPGSDGQTAIYVRVTAADLPPTTTGSANVVIVGRAVGSITEVELASGNPLYTLRARVTPGQLPLQAVAEGIRVRTSELRTSPVNISRLDVGADQPQVDFSVLDRIYAESVIRHIYVRLGSTPDETDPSYGDFEEVSVQGTFAVPDGKPYVQFRVVLEPNPLFADFPRRDYYEFVAVAMRPSIFRAPPPCCLDDDARRVVTWGLDAECDLTTPLGMAMQGLEGFPTTVYCRGREPTLPEADTVWGGPNQRPTVTGITAPPGDVLVGQLWEISVQADDPDNNRPLQYAVDFGDGRGYSPWQFSSSFSVIFSAGRTYTIRARVRDSRLLESADSFTRDQDVIDSLPNQPPVIQNVTFDGGLGQGGTTTFTITGFDPEGATQLEYAAAFQDGTTGFGSWQPADFSSGSIQVSHVWQSAGARTVLFKLRDPAGGESAPASVPLTVETNIAPRVLTLVLENQTTPPQTGTYSDLFITAYDPDGDYPLQSQIDWGAGAGFGTWKPFNVDRTLTRRRHTWVEGEEGTRTIQVQVKDARDLVSAIATIRLAIVSLPIIESVDASPGVLGVLSTITVTANDPTNQFPLSWTVDWDEGNGFEPWIEASGRRYNFGHQWSRAGAHALKFKVRNRSGLESLVTSIPLTVT